jgi:cytidylate kinase
MTHPLPTWLLTVAAAPMVPASDAVMLDTSFLSIDSALQRATALVEARIKGKATVSG